MLLLTSLQGPLPASQRTETIPQIPPMYLPSQILWESRKLDLDPSPCNIEFIPILCPGTGICCQVSHCRIKFFNAAGWRLTSPWRCQSCKGHKGSATSTIIFYSLLYNLNMNKIPNPSYHSIHSPMATFQEGEEADTASESETMAQNKLLHSCSLETFFQGLRGLLFLPWGNDWDCIFPIPLQLIQPHLSSLLASLSSLVISASSSIFIFHLNQAYLLALSWLI